MYFEQFYLTCLAHASYMIGSDGIAAVVDPQRDVEIYLEEARKHKLTIRYIIETHLHADFVSGHMELAERTGAEIYLGAAANAAFPHNPARDGDEIVFGKCRLKFLETPGHTMESMSVLVTDLDRSPEPFGVLTGDTLFIGDVGRPDLSPDKTPQQLAALLYDSLHSKLLTLPDAVEVYPAHGAGSLCGRQMSAERVSTIGKQRATNYALQPQSKEEFVNLLTAELPEKPGYFALDAEINRQGAPALKDLGPLAAMTPQQLLEAKTSGAVILDTRTPDEFGAAHVPGSINIPLSGQYALWAATILGLHQEIAIVAEGSDKVEESRVRLARVGAERVIGYLQDGITAWVREGFPVAEVPQISVLDLEQLIENPDHLQVVDVRRPAEWQAGHLAASQLKPLDKLTARLAGLDPAQPVAVHCRTGYRSSIGASLLLKAGFKNVMNVVGGFEAWQASRLPYESQPAACSTER